MNELFLLRGLIAVSLWLLEATGVLLVAWLVTFLYRKNAARRHLTWLTAFVMLVLIPPITIVMPARFGIAALLPASIQPLSLFKASLPSSWIHHLPEPALETQGSTVPDKLSAAHATKLIKSKNAIQSPEACHSCVQVILGMSGLWLAGVVVVGLQGVSAIYGIVLMRRRSVPYEGTAINLSGLADRVGLKRRWELRVSITSTPPAAMTWGCVHPVVLLPRNAASWPKERLEAVILHELAHVRRCDSLSQLLALCVCALYWFYPAVWLCACAMRAAAEVAADDAVVRAGLKPSAYAEELLHLAFQLGQRRQPLAGIEVSILKHSKIEARIKAIVDPSNRRREITPIEALKAIGLGAVALLTLSSLRPSVSSAQEQHSTLSATMPGNMPHAVPAAVGSSKPGESPASEQRIADTNASFVMRRQRDSADRQDRTHDMVKRRGLTDQQKAKTVYKAADRPDSPARELADADAATALQRERNAGRGSHKDSITGTNVQADETVFFRQRAIAFEDMQRSAGNANGGGKAREAAAQKHTAKINAAHDAASAAQAMAKADYHRALQRKQIESVPGRQGNTSSGAPPVEAITQRAVAVDKRSSLVAPIEPLQTRVLAHPAGPPNKVYPIDSSMNMTR